MKRDFHLKLDEGRCKQVEALQLAYVKGGVFNPSEATATAVINIAIGHLYDVVFKHMKPQ